MGEVLSEIGDLVFSLVIGYIGAIELLYVVRHLYHWSFRHATHNDNEANNLANLQTNLRSQLNEAEKKEALAGAKAMQDGVLYKDGFRIDPQQAEIDNLKEKQKAKEAKEKRRKEIEIELAKQKEIEVETRKQLEEAEAQLAKQKSQAEAEEKKRQQAAEEEENVRKLLEAERIREENQRQLEEQKEAEENVRKLLDAERLQEENQRQLEEQKEAEENVRKLLEAERLQEENQRQLEEQKEAEENLRRLIETERRREEEQKTREESEMKAAEIKLEEENEDDEEEEDDDVHQHQTAEDELDAIRLSKKILSAERDKLLSSTEPLDQESAAERKQKLIEENARKFIEAELEMVELQQQMLEAPQQRKFITEPQAMPVVEELCIRKTVVAPAAEAEIERPKRSVKTQLNQTTIDAYTPKPLLFPSISDDGSSLEPNSSKQSSINTQQSDEISTAASEDITTTIGLQIAQQERQEPDGEDNAPTVQYTDEYLRSLDGIKNKPLVREDGSGRRRAFKKRRSSGSSTSSRDSRASREEELKMFTSLEEEEMLNARKGEDDFTPISYAGESTLKVKAHNRRHKRSPAKDSPKSADDSSVRGSLEMLGEENTNPWGELVPEHYKDTEFWKREKAISIDEEKIEVEKPASEEDASTSLLRKSSFEEATQTENQKALEELEKLLSENKEEENIQQIGATENKTTPSEIQKNLQTSQNTEDNPSPTRSSASPCLRRSPRIDEIAQYEERWKETTEQSADSNQAAASAPSISVESATDNAPWRDEYGLMMQGLSDFYDFQASVNPSRSRSTSRHPSPAVSQPSARGPKNVSYVRETENLADCVDSPAATFTTIEVYDDTGNSLDCEFQRTNIINFIEAMAEGENCVNASANQAAEQLTTADMEKLTLKLKNVADDLSASAAMKLETVPMIFVDSAAEIQTANDDEDSVNMQELVSSLRADRSRTRSRSRSRSPLPSTDNIQRSIETRRNKLIKHNDEVFEKIMDSFEAAASQRNEVEVVSIEVDDSTSISVESLRMERARSKSRSRSPLPTTDNLEQSLEARRKKRIKHNDELFEKLMNIESKDEGGTSESNYLRESASPTEGSRSRSRSRSPLPTADNIQRSLETRRNKLIQHNDEIFERLSLTPPKSAAIGTKQNTDFNLDATPSIVIEPHDALECPTKVQSDAFDDDSPENISKLVASLRVGRSRSRSKTPMRIPTAENLALSLETRTNKLIERNDELFEKLQESNQNLAQQSVTIQYIYETEDTSVELANSANGNLDKRTVNRGRSRSRTPSRSLSNSPNRKFSATMETDDSEQYQFIYTAHAEPNFEHIDSAPMQPYENLIDAHDFHLMLNLEASQNKTLSKNSEEFESSLAVKQRLVDEDALHKLKTASEETELRTLTPIDMMDCSETNSNPNQPEEEEFDTLGEIHQRNRLQKLRCSPTTPEYDRTISQEQQDIQRIKQDRLNSGYKRSTYVGESMDLGSEYENLRREAADFRRSQSPSPTSMQSDLEAAGRNIAERHRIQDQILAQLMTADSTLTDEFDDSSAGGAKPKSTQNSAKELDWSISNEVRDTQRIKEDMLGSGFKRSTYVGESLDLSNIRRETTEFRRSLSKSRSPLDEQETEEIEKIGREAAKRELQDRVLDEIEKTTLNFQDFSRNLNVDFLDNERRASDSALMQKPELLIQLQDSNPDFDMEPEEYHHFRRFSLFQEQPVEEYPSDDDNVYVSQIEIRTLNGKRTWIQKDYYSEDLEDHEINLADLETAQEVNAEIDDSLEDELRDEQEYTDGSEDERQTVVEVDDEIDTDICDFNERGPADESHHEQSECEEAEREMDHYADRDVNDWAEQVEDNEYLDYSLDDINYTQELDDEGAVGGVRNINETAGDSDSFTIDQIYDEAIKNRKQSGILRDYDCILQDMQNHFLESNASGDTEITVNSNNDHYALWAKTRDLEKSSLNRSNGVDSSLNFIENERNENEMRYLGDANMTARQSTRLRSRYGYNLQLQNKANEEVGDVDVNYKPKREYNWRKNFKIDENTQAENDCNEKAYEDLADECEDVQAQYIDIRKFSLGGESITLFSRSPEKDNLENIEEEHSGVMDNVSYAEQEKFDEDEKRTKAEKITEKSEKPKKKKSKKKLRKNSNASVENMNRDDDDSESQMYSRRSSSFQLDTDSPKRKSRSRRSSKSSATTEETSALFSPRSSVGYAEPIADILEEYTPTTAPAKKKIKKRKQPKDGHCAKVQDITEELHIIEPIVESVLPVSTTISPSSESVNVLAALSPQNSPQKSVCVTPASIESEELEELPKVTVAAAITAPVVAATNTVETTATTTTTKTTTPKTTPVDTFDILKDANFYPLF